MIELEPIKDSSDGWEAVEKEIDALFRKEIYQPLMKELKSNTITNSIDDLIGAIESGRLSFYRGEFKGRSNATISRELRKIGARWDRKQGSWKVPLSSLPDDVVDAIDRSRGKFERLVSKLDRLLESIMPEKIAEKLKLSDLFGKIIWRMDQSVRKTLEGIVVVPEVTPEMKNRIASEYEKNMQKYIQDFTEKEIISLRRKVRKNFLQGGRREELIETIKSSYGVSHNKAKFLARQETGLMTSKFRESRYQENGVEEYKWYCVAGSANHPVRPMHKALEGKTFRWDDPPVTSPDGRRNNPGEDFNCRCFARPVVRF